MNDVFVIEKNIFMNDSIFNINDFYFIDTVCRIFYFPDDLSESTADIISYKCLPYGIYNINQLVQSIQYNFDSNFYQYTIQYSFGKLTLLPHTDPSMKKFLTY